MDKVLLSEYPRPQLYRESYLSLNGYWDYSISKSEELPKEYQGKILVPFSPESELSGVNHILQPDEWLFYRLEFEVKDLVIRDKVIIHFMAVDQIATVYLNGKFVGNHIGGYLPFEFEIKDLLQKKNVLIVKVKDYTDTSCLSRGKQKLKHGGIWYTPQSGIYYPVWLESVSQDYIQEVKFTPNIDKEEVVVNIKSEAKEATIHIFNMDRPIDTNKDVHIKVKDMHLWSPEDPYLYFIEISTDNDEVTSYFAMRKFSKELDENGFYRLTLNNKPYFMKGVLDQGYYKKGLYTPESYEDYAKDIKLIKDLGFNTVRKHIKIELPRWYFECDKQGLIVWQDFINGGDKYKLSTMVFPLFTGNHKDDHRYKKFARQNEDGKKQAREEFKDILNYLYNIPSIGLWTIFNEGWGQFDSKEIYEELSEIDKNRLFDHASGWHDQGVSDTKSYHVYFKQFKPDLPEKVGQRAIILSEFGGFVLPVTGHMINGKKVYHSYKTYEDWLAKFKDTIQEDVIENIPNGLSAMIYTQITDVEEELNGFITYDREVIKVKIEDIKNILDRVTY